MAKKNTDTVPTMLTPGEVVLNEKQQQRLGRLIGSNPDKIFGAIGVPGFAQGGQVMKKKLYQDGGEVTAPWWASAILEGYQGAQEGALIRASNIAPELASSSGVFRNFGQKSPLPRREAMGMYGEMAAPEGRVEEEAQRLRDARFRQSNTMESPPSRGLMDAYGQYQEGGEVEDNRLDYPDDGIDYSGIFGTEEEQSKELKGWENYQTLKDTGMSDEQISTARGDLDAKREKHIGSVTEGQKSAYLSVPRHLDTDMVENLDNAGVLEDVMTYGAPYIGDELDWSLGYTDPAYPRNTMERHKNKVAERLGIEDYKASTERYGHYTGRKGYSPSMSSRDFDSYTGDYIGPGEGDASGGAIGASMQRGYQEGGEVKGEVPPKTGGIGLMDIVHRKMLANKNQEAGDEYMRTRDLGTWMTQNVSLQRLEQAGLGNTPVGYDDPHKQPLWESEGVNNPFNMEKQTYSDYIDTGEWNYPNENNMLTANEMKAQMMADYDIIQTGRQKASSKMDKIINQSQAEYNAKPKNVLQALAMKMGLGR